MRPPKLYVVVREDLPPGDQAVQAIHAARQFASEHPEEEAAWFRESNHLAFLAVPDLPSLIALRDRAEVRGIPSVAFEEPDMGNAVTALALSPRAKSICSGLPKALRCNPQDAP